MKMLVGYTVVGYTVTLRDLMQGGETTHLHSTMKKIPTGVLQFVTRQFSLTCKAFQSSKLRLLKHPPLTMHQSDQSYFVSPQHCTVPNAVHNWIRASNIFDITVLWMMLSSCLGLLNLFENYCNDCGHSDHLTLPGVGDGEGVRVEVVLSLDDVLLPRVDLWGVMEELPLVELLGEVVFDMVRNADDAVADLL